MELFGFDFDRLRVSAPDAVQDLGGVLGSVGGSIGNMLGTVADNDVAKALWKPIKYFLPEVRILPERSAGRTTQTFNAMAQPVSTVQAQPASSMPMPNTALLVGGAVLLGVVLAVRR